MTQWHRWVWVWFSRNLERLAPGAGHRQTRNRDCLELRRLSPVLDLEGATRPTRTTSHSPQVRDPESCPTEQWVSIDFFTVPTLRFQVLYVFLVLAHDRRHPSLPCDRPSDTEWTAQKLLDAFAFGQLPRYLLRDRDTIFGQDFKDQVRDMGSREPRPCSPWQRAYVERVLGSSASPLTLLQ